MKEHWQLLAESENKYKISDYGTIVRVLPGRGARVGKVKLPSTDGSGYRFIGFTVRGVLRMYKIHRLVAKYFIGPCPDGYQVNHKDLNKVNNHWKNLEYATASENVRHAIRNGVVWGGFRPGEQHPNTILTDADVRKIRSTPYVHGLQARLARKYSVSHMTIHNIVQRISWKHVK